MTFRNCSYWSESKSTLSRYWKKLRVNFRSCSFSCCAPRNWGEKKTRSWKDVNSFFLFLKCCCVSSLSLDCPSTEELNAEASVILTENVKGRRRLGPKPAQAPCSSAPATVIMHQVTTPLHRKSTGRMDAWIFETSSVFFFFFSRGRGLLTAQQHVLLISSRAEVCVFTLKTHTQQLAGMPPSYSLTLACKTTCSNLFASREKYSNLSLLLSPLQAKHVLLHYVLVSKAKAADTDPL